MPGGREDRLALELVQLDQAGRRKLGTARGIGFGECEREDPTGRSPGNEIEQLAGRTTGLSLQLGEDHRGDDAADAAAIDAQDANWSRHVSVPVLRLQNVTCTGPSRSFGCFLLLFLFPLT